MCKAISGLHIQCISSLEASKLHGRSICNTLLGYKFHCLKIVNQMTLTNYVLVRKNTSYYHIHSSEISQPTVQRSALYKHSNSYFGLQLRIWMLGLTELYFMNNQENGWTLHWHKIIKKTRVMFSFHAMLCFTVALGPTALPCGNCTLTALFDLNKAWGIPEPHWRRASRTNYRALTKRSHISATYH